jgi:hypothetical protein
MKASIIDVLDNGHHPGRDGGSVKKFNQWKVSGMPEGKRKGAQYVADLDLPFTAIGESGEITSAEDTERIARQMAAQGEVAGLSAATARRFPWSACPPVLKSLARPLHSALPGHRLGRVKRDPQPQAFVGLLALDEVKSRREKKI